MPLEGDRETFEKLQFISIQKAINQQEVPAKEKHVRTAILGTYQERNAVIFWHVVRRLQLSTHAITCWKFCHVLHKLLRDGHKKTLDTSIGYKQQIIDLGNIWVHATQTYGTLISKYCKYLVRRMEFLRKYKDFSGNLTITESALDGIGNSDINSYFELCVDIMDCLEYGMDLQEGIFKTLDFSKAISMTGPGQCRLAPCIPVMLDSSQFYDCSLKLLFKLHGCLPPDTLTGHRDRFTQLFGKLKRFFYQCSNMQYFKTLIQIPLLPDEPPNFLIKHQEHQFEPTLVVEAEPQLVEREPSPEPIIEPVVEPLSVDFDAVFGASQPVYDPRDELICQLRDEIQKLQEIIEQMTQDHLAEVTRLLHRINELEQNEAIWVEKSASTKLEIQNLKKELVLAHDQVDQGAQKIVTLNEVERKAVANEELYKRMKSKYMNLVKDHADLMRKSSDFQKSTEVLQMSAKDYESKESKLMSDNAKLQKMLEKIENDLRLAQENQQEEAYKLFLYAVEAAEVMIEEAMRDMQDPLNDDSTCSALLLITTIKNSMASLENVQGSAENFFKGSDQKDIVKALASFGHTLSQTMLNGISTCHMVSDDSGKELKNACHVCGKESLKYLATLKTFTSHDEGNLPLCSVQDILEKMLVIAEELLPKMEDIGQVYLQDIVEKEMSSTSSAIESAALRIEEMLSQARERDTGINLEVNERILDSCTELMLAIKALIISSKELQREIVEEGRGASSIKEFYMKNSRWTEGLISAAKAVGFGATLLTDAADQAVLGQGKFEEIIVCSHEIAASTAQLVAASRVKANKMSVKLPKLQNASKNVNAVTGHVVASANTARKQTEENTDDIADLSKFTLTQIKRKEMDSQVRLLELEQSLQQERIKLGKLRRQHYLIAGIDEENESTTSESIENNTHKLNRPTDSGVTPTVAVDPPPKPSISKPKPPLPIKPSWT